MLLGKDSKILFMGDSITDAGVWMDPEKSGIGYVRFIRDFLYSKYPEMGFELVNKGIGGQRSIDLLNRWQKDVIEERPDFLSLCIGANDIWRQYDSDLDISTPDDFEVHLRKMLALTREYLDIPVILIEIQPFENTCLEMAEWPFAKKLYEEGGPQVNQYNDRVRKLSAEFNTYYCPVNKIITNNRMKNPDIKYTHDGVHPNSTGIAMIGLSWLNSLGL